MAKEVLRIFLYRERGRAARMPSYLASHFVKSGLPVTLLEEYEPPLLPANLIYPSQRKVPLKLRAFIDFSVPRLRERIDVTSTDASGLRNGGRRSK